MASWRRLAGVLGRHRSWPRTADDAPALLSRLHCVRPNSSLSVQLEPGIDPNDFLKEAFVDVVKGDTKAESAYIGYSITGRIQVEAPIVIQPQDAFAIVQLGAKQFKVTSGDILYVEKLKHADINHLLSLNKVLLLGTKSDTIVGRPYVQNAAVSAIVEEHALDATVLVFKKKRRKNYRRCNTHRQMLTRIRITRIRGLEKYLESPQSQQMLCP